MFGIKIWKNLWLLIVIFRFWFVIFRLFWVNFFWVVIMCILVFICNLEGNLVFCEDWLLGWWLIWYNKFWKIVWFCLKLVVLMFVRLLEMVLILVFCVFKLDLFIYNVECIIYFICFSGNLIFFLGIKLLV